MKNLSISTAWNQTLDLVQREGRLLFPVAFALVSVPAVILQFLTPPMAAGDEPELGAWMLLIPAVVVLSIVGVLTISLLALRPGTMVRDAIANGMRRLLPLLGAALLVGLAAALIAIPLATLLKTGGTGGALGLGLMFLIALGFLAVVVRLQLMNPVAAAERVGVVGIVRRSWELTRGHFWKLLAVLLLFVVLFIVVSLAVAATGGLIILAIAGFPHPGSLSALLVLLLGGIVNSVLVVVFTVMIARIYAQVAAD